MGCSAPDLAWLVPPTRVLWALKVAWLHPVSFALQVDTGVCGPREGDSPSEGPQRLEKGTGQSRRQQDSEAGGRAPGEIACLGTDAWTEGQGSE